MVLAKQLEAVQAAWWGHFRKWRGTVESVDARTWVQINQHHASRLTLSLVQITLNDTISTKSNKQKIFPANLDRLAHSGCAVKDYTQARIFDGHSERLIKSFNQRPPFRIVHYNCSSSSELPSLSRYPTTTSSMARGILPACT